MRVVCAVRRKADGRAGAETILGAGMGAPLPTAGPPPPGAGGSHFLRTPDIWGKAGEKSVIFLKYAAREGTPAGKP